MIRVLCLSLLFAGVNGVAAEEARPLTAIFPNLAISQPAEAKVAPALPDLTFRFAAWGLARTLGTGDMVQDNAPLDGARGSWEMLDDFWQRIGNQPAPERGFIDVDGPLRQLGDGSIF